MRSAGLSALSLCKRRLGKEHGYKDEENDYHESGRPVQELCQ